MHSAKLKVDGITKYLDHNQFHFDHSFDEAETTEDLYKYTTMPLVDFVVSGKGGRATCFAYGQTGSGKTYTMSGIQVREQGGATMRARCGTKQRLITTRH